MGARKVRFSGNTVVLPSGLTRRFGQTVTDAKTVSGITVVVLEGLPTATGPQQNVYGIDDLANLVWRIPALDFPDERDYYTGLWGSDEGIVAVHYSGFIARIDPATGRILSTEFVK